MIEIIKDKKRWNEQLSLITSGHLDVYHTYDYHQITKKETDTPILIKYSDGDNSLVLPLIIRAIENSDYKDATSVYGYAGILTLHLNGNFDKENFHKELNAFFKDYKIVSVFSRLHPFLENQESLLEGLGTITTRGKVVYIDLNDTLENQRKMFNKRMKTYLNKSRKTCTVIESKLKSDLDSFIDLYHENMKRVGADESYFFDNSYFYQLVGTEDFNTKLMLCIHDETQTIIGGALFMEKGSIVQYHLSGLNEEFNDLNAIKLIIDEIRIKKSNRNFKYLNLGGGRGSDEDSLFAFKRCFSKNFKDFKIWKYIVNENAYRMLVEDQFESSLESVVENTSFFPAYRSRELQKF